MSEMKASHEPKEMLAYFCFQVQLKKQPLSTRKSLSANKMEKLQEQLKVIQQNQNEFNKLEKVQEGDEEEIFSDDGDSDSQGVSNSQSIIQVDNN